MVSMEPSKQRRDADDFESRLHGGLFKNPGFDHFDVRPAFSEQAAEAAGCLLPGQSCGILVLQDAIGCRVTADNPSWSPTPRRVQPDRSFNLHYRRSAMQAQRPAVEFSKAEFLERAKAETRRAFSWPRPTIRRPTRPRSSSHNCLSTLRTCGKPNREPICSFMRSS